jgi:hypothetical protein
MAVQYIRSRSTCAKDGVNSGQSETSDRTSCRFTTSIAVFPTVSLCFKVSFAARSGSEVFRVVHVDRAHIQLLVEKIGRRAAVTVTIKMDFIEAIGKTS